MILSLIAILTLFTVIPTYYSDNECDLYGDLERYEMILHDDPVIQAFQTKQTISYVKNIDESNPLKALIVYEHKDEKSVLEVYVRETGPIPDQCFVPIHYTYKYYEGEQLQQTQYYFSESQKMVDLLNTKIILSPYKQLKQGIPLESIICKDPLELHIKNTIKPLCIKSETYEKLVQRGYF